MYNFDRLYSNARDNVGQGTFCDLFTHHFHVLDATTQHKYCFFSVGCLFSKGWSMSLYTFPLKYHIHIKALTNLFVLKFFCFCKLCNVFRNLCPGEREREEIEL